MHTLHVSSPYSFSSSLSLALLSTTSTSHFPLPHAPSLPSTMHYTMHQLRNSFYSTHTALPTLCDPYPSLDPTPHCLHSAFHPLLCIMHHIWCSRSICHLWSLLCIALSLSSHQSPLFTLYPASYIPSSNLGSPFSLLTLCTASFILNFA